MPIIIIIIIIIISIIITIIIITFKECGQVNGVDLVIRGP